MERGRTQRTGTALITYENAVDLGVFDGRIMATTSTTDIREITSPPAEDTRVSRKGHKVPLIAGIVLLTLGVAAVGYGIFSLVITNIITAREQAALSDRFAERQALAAGGLLGDVFDPRVVPAGDDEDPTFDEFDQRDVPILVGVEDAERPDDLYDHPDWKAENPPERGEPIGRIVIPKINLDYTVIHGVSAAELRKGPGHMPRTPVPGQYGNSVISGHRTTYGAPFHNLDRLEPGDLITVETLIGVHTYEVVSLEIVMPDHVWVIQPREGAWLTLTTCHPKFSSQQRLVVFAKLIDGPNIDLVTEYHGTDYPAPEAPEGTSPVRAPVTTTTTTTTTTIPPTTTTTTTTAPTTTTTTTTTTSPTTTTTSTTTTTTSTSTTSTTTTTVPDEGG